MSTDIEQELRELFREKADEAPLSTPRAPATAPPQVLRRGRRRQVGTVLGSLGVVAVLVVGSVAGLQRILADGPEPLPTARYDVFERTATVEAFTVTSPSDWYLVNQWPLSLTVAVEGTSGSSSFECQGTPIGEDIEEIPECTEAPGDATAELIPIPQGLPMIQLTNVDMGLDANACRDGIPNTGAALYVAYDAERGLPGTADPTIPPFPPGPGLPPEGDGACGPGRYANFTVNGEPFFAWIGLGSNVTAEDREIVETAYEQMSAIRDWTPVAPDELTPAYVIAGGATDQYGPWRIEVRPSGGGVEMTMIGVVGASAPFALPDGSLDWCCPGVENGVLFGAVRPEASGVGFRPSEGDPVTGTIVPLPSTLGSGFDLFFLEGAIGPGDVVAMGLGAGEPVSAAPSPSPSPATSTVTSLSGGNEEHTWIVRFTGSFADDSACVRVRFDAEALDPFCPTLPEGVQLGEAPSLNGWLTDSTYLLAGAVPLEVQDIRFVSDQGGSAITELQCTTGPVGWPDTQVCALTLPPQGSGTMRYLDADGDVLFADGMGWGSSQAAPPAELGGPLPVDPVQGGTYWAVYPWIGSPGDPLADEFSAILAEQYAIEAFPGELGCDQGAAEALGRSDTDHAIGVYFDTRVDARAFADQLEISSGIPDAPIARVTTYCLN